MGVRVGVMVGVRVTGIVGVMVGAQVFIGVIVRVGVAVGYASQPVYAALRRYRSSAPVHRRPGRRKLAALGGADEAAFRPWEPEMGFVYEPPGSGHPLLYVSEAKHGLYPSENACEDYSHSFVWGACEIEDCGDDDDPPRRLTLFTPPEHNVGELYGPTEPFLASPLLAQLFPGESAWGGHEFCGGQEVIVVADIPGIEFLETCAGSVSGKWLPPLNYSLDVEMVSFDVDAGWTRYTLDTAPSQFLAPVEYAPPEGR